MSHPHPTARGPHLPVRGQWTHICKYFLKEKKQFYMSVYSSYFVVKRRKRTPWMSLFTLEILEGLLLHCGLLE